VLGGDPRTAYEAADAGLTMARRHGLQGFIRTLSANLASAAIEVGEWDRAEAVLTSARDEAVDDLGANHAAWALLQLMAMRGDDVRAEASRLTAWAEELDEEGARGALHDLRAYVALAERDLRAACDEWLAFAPTDALNAESAYLMAGVAALGAMDGRRATGAVTGLETLPGHARLRTFDARMLRAGIELLNEDVAEPVREVLSVIAEYERWGLPFRAALAGVVLARTAGVDRPEVRAAAGAARETLVRLGARPFIDLLDEALSGPPRTSERRPGQAARLAAPDTMSSGA
jgi:hypothetical protein